MTTEEIAHFSADLLTEYPGANIVVNTNQAEVIAELVPGRAVAVIERTAPHFHRTTTEVFRGLRGTFVLVAGGKGHVLGPGDSMTIEPGVVHQVRGIEGPAWIEVRSTPPWSPLDHFPL